MNPEMIERAARSIVRRNFPSLSEADSDEMWEGYALDATAAIASVADQLREEGARVMIEAVEPIISAFECSHNCDAVDEAFIWESLIEQRPLITYGAMRRLSATIRALSAADIARGIGQHMKGEGE